MTHGVPLTRHTTYLERLDVSDAEDVYYTFNGRIVSSIEDIPKYGRLQRHYRLRGGKGGFGSMLRAIGSQIEKTTNHEMCRDLSGRRMRDVNLERKLKEWYATADERESKKWEEHIKRRQKRQELLKKGLLPGHNFSDRGYERQKRKIAYELRSALDTAIENTKREKKQTRSATKERQLDAKRARLWIEEIDKALSSSSSDEEMLASSSSDTFLSLIKQEDSLRNKCGTDDRTDSTEIIDNTKINVITSDEDKELESVCKITSTEAIQPLTDQQLRNADTSDMLEMFGLDVLKATLMARGLKCGGTLKERALRLFLVKDLSLDQYPVKLLAKNR
ncbi:hypothetical protein MN116_004065 [Schistosoma mekongi]|uniref:Replication stress response regulator SDE2 n=1 Tax=Schistosoma mekongi TaxID=38744 RepID=A0AAE1ZGG4_SCHME|nr:hypothetical protein MN116_004065 [Schistosoma mekongi]